MHVETAAWMLDYSVLMRWAGFQRHSSMFGGALKARTHFQTLLQNWVSRQQQQLLIQMFALEQLITPTRLLWRMNVNESYLC